MFDAPVPQDARGELVVGVAGPAQHHLHHLLAGPAAKGEGQVRRKDVWFVPRSAGGPPPCGHCHPLEPDGRPPTRTGTWHRSPGAARMGPSFPKHRPGPARPAAAPAALAPGLRGREAASRLLCFPPCWQAILPGTSRHQAPRIARWCQPSPPWEKRGRALAARPRPGALRHRGLFTNAI